MFIFIIIIIIIIIVELWKITAFLVLVPGIKYWIVGEHVDQIYLDHQIHKAYLDHQIKVKYSISVSTTKLPVFQLSLALDQCSPCSPKRGPQK